MKPVVSVVTPSFNQGTYIEKTIVSVLAQDHPNVEYLVVDGGSTDNTLDILKKYGGKIKWLSEHDRGQADAIQKGIGMTEGDIIAWLNSDDILLPGSISKVVEAFHHNPDMAMVYGKSHFIDSAEKIVGKFPTEPFDFDRLAAFNFICQPSAFFKREAFYDVGGLDLNLDYALDYDLWIRIGQKFQLMYLPEFLASYRLHETSKTVAYHHALENHKEVLDTALKYYNWAPANRVYGYCYHVIEPKLPQSFERLRPLTITLALLFSLVKYLQLNKSIRHADIKAINLANLRKLRTPWKALYKYY